MFKIIACSALLAALASTASAASYQTVVNFTPGGAFGTSTDTADGNQLVLDWETSLTAGFVDLTDLTDLTFSLFGTGGLIFADMAIISGVFQPIGGVSRDETDMSFNFDLDIAPTGAAAGLFEAVNDGTLIQEGSATGLTYALGFQLIPSGSVLQGARFNDGVLDLANSVVVIPSEIPVPPAALAALTGLGALVGLRRSRKRKTA